MRCHTLLAGDVFLRPPEEKIGGVAEPTYFSSDEYTSAYKKYNVVRKLPMIMGRQERVFAIDGEYIYIMPPENRNFFDTVKTVGG